MSTRSQSKRRFNFVANAMLTLNRSLQDTSKGTVKSIIIIALNIENDLPIVLIYHSPENIIIGINITAWLGEIFLISFYVISASKKRVSTWHCFAGIS